MKRFIEVLVTVQSVKTSSIRRVDTAAHGTAAAEFRRGFFRITELVAPLITAVVEQKCVESQQKRNKVR